MGSSSTSGRVDHSAAFWFEDRRIADDSGNVFRQTSGVTSLGRYNPNITIDPATASLYRQEPAVGRPRWAGKKGMRIMALKNRPRIRAIDSSGDHSLRLR